MSCALCIPCKNKGKFRAVYRVVKGVPMCGGCVADYEANPPEKQGSQVAGKASLGDQQQPQAAQFLETVKEEKGTKMPRQIAEETKAAIRADAQTGMNINAIATKHGIGWATARDIVKNAKGRTRAAGRGDSSPAKRAVTKSGASRFADTIEVLREERERIDRVIADLEHMG